LFTASILAIIVAFDSEFAESLASQVVKFALYRTFAWFEQNKCTVSRYLPVFQLGIRTKITHII